MMLKQLEGKGFRHEDTGGNCTCAIKDYECIYVQITKDNDALIPEDIFTPITVGVYSMMDEGVSGEIITSENFESVATFFNSELWKFLERQPL